MARLSIVTEWACDAVGQTMQWTKTENPNGCEVEWLSGIYAVYLIDGDWLWSDGKGDPSGPFASLSEAQSSVLRIEKRLKKGAEKMEWKKEEDSHGATGRWSSGIYHVYRVGKAWVMSEGSGDPLVFKSCKRAKRAAKKAARKAAAAGYKEAINSRLAEIESLIKNMKKRKQSGPNTTSLSELSIYVLQLRAEIVRLY